MCNYNFGMCFVRNYKRNIKHELFVEISEMSCLQCVFGTCRAFDVTDDSAGTSHTSRRFHSLHLTVPSKFSTTSASSAQTYSRPPPSASPTPAAATTPSSPGPPTASASSKPPVIHFKAQFCGLAVGASLLPSLKAQYKV